MRSCTFGGRHAVRLRLPKAAHSARARAFTHLGRALVAARKVLVLHIHRLELVAHLRRGAVGLLHEVLQALRRLAALLGRDRRQALAVALLDLPDVVPDTLGTATA